MTRITSLDGNVIAADFGQDLSLDVRITTQVLYEDEDVMLLRATGQTRLERGRKGAQR